MSKQNFSFKKNYRVIIILCLILLAGIIGYAIGVKMEEKYNLLKSAQTIPPNDMNSNIGYQIPHPQDNTVEATDLNMAHWKTYHSQYFTIQYPPSWYVNRYSSMGDTLLDAVEISDVQNSPLTLIGASDTHARISVGIHTGVMQTDYGWTNGASHNPTIRAYSINGYQGIWGNQDSEAGPEELVDLRNPQGRYAELVFTPPLKHSVLPEVIFSQVLSTFHFTSL